MNLLRNIVLIGCVGLIALTPAACNRGDEKKQPPDAIAPINLGITNKVSKPPDPRIKNVQQAVDKGVAFLRKQVPLSD